MSGLNDTSPIDPDPQSADSRKTLWIVLSIIAGFALVFLFWQWQSRATVPDVVGANQTAAVAVLAEAGFEMGAVSVEATLAVEPGTVIAQTPAGGEKARIGTPVDIVVAALPDAEVPNVVGELVSQAEADLAAAGLRMGDLVAEVSDKPVGEVLTQAPAAGEQAEFGAYVSMSVSAGPTEGEIPDVEGLLSADAAEVLVSAGFDVKQKSATSDSVEAGYVISQSPSEGTTAEKGSTVTITVSTGKPASETPPADTGDEAQTPTEPAKPDTPETPETPPAQIPEVPPVDGAGPEQATVPDVMGMGPLEAFRALRKERFQVAFEWTASDEQLLTVIGQDPEAGSAADPGSTVTISIAMPSFALDAEKPATLPAPAPEQPEDSGPASETTPAP